jgi:tetratricopeptide (TPR) repeat protein
MRRSALSLALLLAAAAPPDPAASLLDALKSAPSEQQAEQLETRIATIWRAQITPAVQLLVEHAMAAMAHQDRKAAIGDLDAALDLQPDQADLWRLHAEARFANGDEKGAFADLAQALSRDPRCFPALVDLSHFSESREDYAGALQAWQKLLQLDPKARQGEARLQALQRKVSGQQL